MPNILKRGTLFKSLYNIENTKEDKSVLSKFY